MITIEKLNLKQLRLEGQSCLRFVNGQLLLDESQLDNLPDDLVVTDIKTAQRNYPDLFKRLEFNGEPNLGLFFYVPKNLKKFDLIQLLFTGSQDVELSHLFYLEQGSELNLIEKYRSTATNHKIKHRIYLEANARLSYYKLQEEGSALIHSDECLVQQDRDSFFSAVNICLGGQNSEDSWVVKLQEAHAGCDLKALTYAKQKQVLKHQVRVEHLSPYCSSQQTYHNMAKDAARVSFSGRVVVHPKAQRTEAQQLNKNLLLSAKAEIDAKPELEIYADDVKCSHGSTVGQLDQNALFYLRSRGLSLAEAEKILICAFAFNILEEISNDKLAAFLKAKLVKSLTLDAFQEGHEDE